MEMNIFFIVIKKCKNRFWKDVLKAWYMLEQKNTSLEKGVESLLKTPIWHNNLFKIENKSIFYHDWYRKGISVVNDFIKKQHFIYFQRILSTV